MIYEMRTYRMKTGTVPAYLKLVDQEGIAVQRGHLGQLVAYFFSDIGPLNEIVHIWAYTDLNDRASRRAGLAADPQWQTFLTKIQPLIKTMKNKILLPASFSPLS